MPAMILILDLGCKTIGNTEFTVLGTGVCQYLTQLLVTLAKKKQTKKNNDVNLGYITIGKTELSVLTGCRRVVYAISVHTQPFGMLAVIYILCTQLLCTLNQYHC